MKKLKAEAQSLGFSLLGFSSAQPPGSFPKYQQWIDAGCHADMKYMAEARHILPRKNPKLLLSSAQSVISFAFPYPNPALYSQPSHPRVEGRIAGYAWLADYHQEIEQRLETLVCLMESELSKNFEFYIAVDSSPVLERDFGQQAGIGWIGKNSCLISPDSGSFFLLAEVICNIRVDEIELLFDAELEEVIDHCGSCRRCIEACPTGCIGDDRTLDAGRCISYLTIENKGIIPHDLRPFVGDWIFGCDICQMVCPWNIRFAPKSWQDEHLLRKSIDLYMELRINEFEFKNKYKKSPILRTKYKGWMRNLCVVAGNVRDDHFIDELKRIIPSGMDPLIRAHAVWAYYQITGADGLEFLNSCKVIENVPLVVDEYRRLPL